MAGGASHFPSFFAPSFLLRFPWQFPPYWGARQGRCRQSPRKYRKKLHCETRCGKADSQSMLIKSQTISMHQVCDASPMMHSRHTGFFLSSTRSSQFHCEPASCFHPVFVVFDRATYSASRTGLQLRRCCKCTSTGPCLQIQLMFAGYQQ